MSQIAEDWARPYYVRCADIGLNCNCVIFGKSEEKVMDESIIHMFEYHTINSEEMTSEMKSKIKENACSLAYYINNIWRRLIENIGKNTIDEKIQWRT